MTAEKQTRRTLLLDDIPAEKDAFASDGSPGPYQRLADSIVELITSRDEQGGKMIGLEGGWGSGKSTVVKFARDRLMKDDDYAVISFDAWAHEGDPLRRTYLETIIKALQEREWVDEKLWDEKKKEIANRKKVERTTTTSSATPLGKLLSLTALGLPAGAAFLACGFDNLGVLDWDASPAWTFIIGLLLTFAPLFIVGIHALRLWFTRPVSWRNVFQSDRWHFLESEATSETETETVEMPNPTSIEFEGYFTDAMNAALGADENRRLLLVLDNLDRVDPEDAISIWSTLQTFLQEGSHREDGWFKQLWVLVPYDPNGLCKLWDNRKADQHQGAQDQRNEEEAPDASSYFFDKSFQIRFRVPPPVLSDWKPYLFALVAKAFPDHGEEDRHALYRVFEHCRPNADEPPTPRELKLYVNQIGAIHRQWQDGYPISHIAYYVLQCRNHQSIVQKLRSDNFPDANAERLLGDSLQQSLAGLAFNAPAHKGFELLLADPIYQSLANGRHEELIDLKSRHTAGFWAVLDVVASTKIQEAEPLVIAQAGRCLLESSLLGGAEAPEATTICKEIRSAAERLDQWHPFDETMAQGISALCCIQDDLSFSKKLGNAMTKTLAAAKPQEDSPATENVVDALLTVLRCIRELEHMDAIPKRITLAVDAAGWIEACEKLAREERDELYWQYVRPKAKFEEVASAVVEAVNGGEFAQEHIATVLVTDASPVKSPWNGVVTAMTTRLDVRNSSESTEVSRLLEGLWQLRRLGSPEATSSLETLVSGGQVMHHLRQAILDDDWECQAICIMTSLREQPKAPTPPAVGHSADGHRRLTALLKSTSTEITDRIVLLLRKHDELDVLFDIADEREENTPLIDACLRAVAGSGAPHELFTSDVVLERWPAIQDALNTEEDQEGFDSLIVTLVKEHKLCQDIQSGEEPFSTSDAALYWRIVMNADTDIASFLGWCKEGLEKTGTEAWSADLQDTCECVRLAVALADAEVTPHLTTHFSDALVEHAELLAAGEHVPEKTVLQHWQDVLSCLDENVRSSLRPRLLSVAVESGGDLHEAFFQMYGVDVAASQLLSDNHKTVPNLFAALVEKNNVPGLRWLKGFLESNKAFLNSVSSKTDVKAFETRLRDRLIVGVDGEAQTLVEEIAGTLGITVPEVESDDSDGDESEATEK